MRDAGRSHAVNEDHANSAAWVTSHWPIGLVHREPGVSDLLGALFASLFGFSFGSLKVSTLVLLAGGLGGMVLFATEHGLSARQGGISCAHRADQPLTLLLGFSTMTDKAYKGARRSWFSFTWSPTRT
jgi:hypothetical protein